MVNFKSMSLIASYSLAYLNSHSGDLGDLVHDEYGYVNDTRTFDWMSMDHHHDGILGRSLVVSRKIACLNYVIKSALH